ncbi:MAG: pirin family protein [Fibrobacter sp.]|nr:pirin family protein [Fibrobacter sp.]
MRQVEQVLSPRPYHWVGDGFKVHNFIPALMPMERMNPFVMFDYNAPYKVPASSTPRGVGVHPHRGFETVTIAYQGKVQHHDSSGAGGIIGEGDVQWMTAGSGVLHKEYHEKEWSRQGGVFQMVQLWVNLPQADKMTAPKYQAITNGDMGRHQLSTGGFIEVIAGKYQETAGPASTFSPIQLYNAKLQSQEKASFSLPANYNTALLAVKGSAIINEKDELPVNHLALMENQGEKFNIKAQEDSIILVMSGEPFHEPIAAHGPFVMNTREEIMEAFEDLRAGKFGYLED